MANAILLRAVNGTERSKPIKAYNTKDAELPTKFVLRIDEKVNNETGEDQLRISNYSMGIIASHSKEWLEEAVTGFRRKKGDDEFIIVERLKDDVPTVASLTKLEAY